MPIFGPGWSILSAKSPIFSPPRDQFCRSSSTLKMADAALYAVGAAGFVYAGGLGAYTYKKYFAAVGPDTSADNKPLLYEEKEETDLTGWIFNNRKIIIKEELGRGNVGVVYRAEKEGQPCVVKRLLKDGITNKDFRIINELRRLVHPSLVQCLGICPNYTSPKMLQQPVVQDQKLGESGATLLKKDDVKLKNAFLIAYEHMEVGPLFHALHDSSKSSVNVLLDSDLVAKVSDFGMQFLVDTKNVNSSPLWTAPEVLKGASPRKESDAFSFGVILWELMTRRVPYVAGVDREVGNVRWQQVQKVKNGERPPLPSGLPAVVDKLITDCWQTSPSRRPNFKQILQSLSLSLCYVIMIKMMTTTRAWAAGIGRNKNIGSFGRVIATTWKGTRVAVKLIDMYAEVTRNQAQAFITELSILCGLRHPNVVLFQGAVLSHEKYMCIIMELCERNSLYDVLNDKNESLDYNAQMKMLLQIAEAMDYLHHGFRKDRPVLHCDLKSGNILLTRDYDIKVCDFGLSQIVQKRLSGAVSAAGNPYWTAPEVMAGAEYTKASDVYSYGVVAWEIFARKRPFPSMNPHQATLAVLMEDARPKIPDFVPPAIRDLINDCWQKDAKNRPMFPKIIERLKATIEEGLPRESLSLKNAKLYMKKTHVYAFRSKDRFVFHKSWGKSTSNPGDFIIFGPGGDVYTCAHESFKATYELVGSEPHLYRKKAKILARMMEKDFLVVTLEGLAKGDAGNYLAENLDKHEQWAIDAKTFEETYMICPKQDMDENRARHVLNEADKSAPPMTPDSGKRKISSRKARFTTEKKYGNTKGPDEKKM
eukprot:jgi/Bigna1/69282/fgenesh1_pg.8_\